MNRNKLVILVLSSVLAVLLIIFIIAFITINKKETTANIPITGDKDVVETEVEPTYNSKEYIDQSIEGLGNISYEEDSADYNKANEVLKSDLWTSIIDEIKLNLTADDFEYIGRESNDDRSYIYKIKGTDVAVSVYIDESNEYIGINRYFNVLGNAYGNLYFLNGVPDNADICYSVVSDDALYVTDYVDGDVLTYWESTNEDDKFVVEL